MSRKFRGSLAFDTRARTVGAMTTTDYGPQTEQILALIERCKTLTEVEVLELVAARDAAWGAAWDAARGAARDAAWGAAWDAARGAALDAARGAAWGAALALIVRDLISAEDYDLLTRPWRTVIGPLHPDDPEASLDPAGLLAWQGLARSMPEQPLTLIHELAAECMARP